MAAIVTMQQGEAVRQSANGGNGVNGSATEPVGATVVAAAEDADIQLVIDVSDMTIDDWVAMASFSTDEPDIMGAMDFLRRAVTNTDVGRLNIRHLPTIMQVVGEAIGEQTNRGN